MGFRRISRGGAEVAEDRGRKEGRVMSPALETECITRPVFVLMTT
jgi:hypothetical protein